MKSKLFIVPVLGISAFVSAGVALAQAGTGAAPTPGAQKVGVIDIQSALVQTKDGQKAAAELQSKFTPKKNDLDRKQGEIAQAQETLRKGSNTMSEDAKQKIMRDIDAKTTSLKRETEDANADLEQEQGKIMNELGGKLMAVLNKYAADNGYVLVLDVSNQQTPVLFASNTIDITRDIIALYDKSASTLAPASKPGAASGTSGITNSPRPAGGSPAIPARKNPK